MIFDIAAGIILAIVLLPVVGWIVGLLLYVIVMPLYWLEMLVREIGGWPVKAAVEHAERVRRCALADHEHERADLAALNAARKSKGFEAVAATAQWRAFEAAEKAKEPAISRQPSDISLAPRTRDHLRCR